MAIIYSRPRFNKKESRSFNNENKIKKIVKKILKISVILMIALFIFIHSFKTIEPTFKKICLDEAKSKAILISNKEAKYAMENYTYEDLMDVQKDADGNVVMIKANINPINGIMSDVAVRVQEKINEYEEDTVYLSLGSLTGIEVLTAAGPKIPVKISTGGNVETTYESEFVSVGINQTKHRIYLDVVCEISILTPFEEIKTNVTNQIVLAENVIVGKVPNNMYDFGND